jgi:DNA replication protein DnaC
MAQEHAELEERQAIEEARSRQGLLEARFQQAGLPERHKSLTVDDLVDGRARGKGPAIKAVQAFREGQPVQVKAGDKNSLVLYGPVGTGKTAMLTEVARCWLEAGKVVLFVQYNRFIASIQATYGGDGSWQELVEAAVGCDLLVLDDVGDPDGAERAESADRREKVFLVVNERYNLDRPVVLATNLDRDEFRRTFGERIADRLGEMAAWVKVGGENLRKA